MVAQYHQILDNEALIINDIGRCASCHQPGWPGDDEVAAGTDPFAGGELAKERTIEAAGSTIIDILDAGGLAKARGSRARLEAFLASQRGLVFEQQGEPLGVFEGAGFGIGIKFLEPL